VEQPDNPSEGSKVTVPNDEAVVPEETDDGQAPKGHPAWDEILTDLPDEIQEILKPKLAKWDSGVQEKFQQIHEQYDPYKPLIENNINANQVEQALFLAHQLDSDPTAFIQKAIDHFNLEQFRQQAAAEVPDDEDDDFLEESPYGDLEKDPRFKAFLEKQQELEAKFQEREQSEYEAEAEQALDTYLKELRDNHGEFDNDYVVTLIANGMDGEQAVKQFQDKVNQAAAALVPPAAVKPQAIIAGGGGTSGSGIPDQPVSFGKMKSGAVSDIVAQYINQANQG
jgi:hypothetical protein